MPYESFKCAHHVSIRGLVQDRQTGSWRYLIQVKRVMQDETTAAAAAAAECDDGHQAPPPSSSASSSSSRAHWQRRPSSSSFAATSPASSSVSMSMGSGHVYSIRRSFAEFKLLHAAMKSLMRNSRQSAKSSSALPSLPVDSIFAFFVGETQTMLQKKRLALENILIAIENHSAASDSSEYLEFLAKTDTYEQVSKAPLSPPPLSLSASESTWTHSLASTASTASSITSDPSASSGDDDDSRDLSASSIGHSRLMRAATVDEDEKQSIPERYRSEQRRRKSTEANAVADTMPARENRVDFHRYSLV